MKNTIKFPYISFIHLLQNIPTNQDGCLHQKLTYLHCARSNNAILDHYYAALDPQIYIKHTFHYFNLLGLCCAGYLLCCTGCDSAALVPDCATLDMHHLVDFHTIILFLQQSHLH